MITPADDALVNYLAVLAGGAPGSAFLELRYRVAEQTLAAEFFPARDTAALADAILSRAGATDVYVGCAPRVRRSGTRRDIAQVWVLWAECDGTAAARAARSYDPAPAIVIASGTGANVHAYWPLRAPLPPREAEHANLRLARAVDADEACYDSARILRPPATWNHKTRPPAAVKAVRVEPGITYEPRDVLASAPTLSDDRIHRRWQERGARDDRGDPLLRIPPAVYVSRLLGVNARSGRKVRCPFHADTHPSLHVYPTPARGWTCFSCGRGGSIYDLAAPLFGMGTRGAEFIELRRLLGQHFARETERVARDCGFGRQVLR
jgi:CHC2-type zinc finger protein